MAADGVDRGPTTRSEEEGLQGVRACVCFWVYGFGFRVVGFGFRVGAFGGGGLVSYAAWRGFIVIQVLQGFLLDKKRAIPKPANLAWIVRV